MTYNPKIAERVTDVSVRQTVLSGSVDIDNRANFINAGSGRACSILASIPINVAFADDQDNYVETITDSSIAWTDLTANAVHFLYVDRNVNTGELTYGSVMNLPPVYADKFQGVTKSLLQFNGVDGSQNIVDHNSDVTWTVVNQTQLDTAEKKFGVSSLFLDGASDWLTQTGLDCTAGAGFKIDFFLKLNQEGVTKWILYADTAWHLGLLIRNTKLELYAGNGGSWTPINAAVGAGDLNMSTGWYHIRVQWDGTTYKVYLDGVEDITRTSSVAFVTAPNELRLSTTGASFHGWYDEFRYEVGPQTLGTFTPRTTPYGGIAVDNEHWFDMTEFKMKYWDDSTARWINVQRVFLGECDTDTTSVTSVVTYAINGESSHKELTLAVSTQYSQNHNIGINNLEYETWFECKIDNNGYTYGDRIPTTGDWLTGRHGGMYWDRNIVSMSSSQNQIGVANIKTTGAAFILPVASWAWGIHIKRVGF